jgi:methionine-rich copper-binding protein CopC
MKKPVLISGLAVLLAALLTACPPPTPTPDTTAPSTPTGFKATAGNAKVKLEWNASGETDLANYTIRWGSSPTSQNATVLVAKTDTQRELTGLTNGTVYYFKLEASDTAGNTSSSTSVVSATPVAPDTTPPTLVSSLPSANSVGVALNTQVRLTFSESMNPSTVMVTSSNLTLGAASWSSNNTIVSFLTPALTFDTVYSLNIAGQDMAGNALASTILQFTALAAPPTVVSTTPANNATGVALTPEITVRFSRPMDKPSVEANTLVGATTCSPWVWSDNDQTAKCTVANTLAFDTSYTIAVSTSAQSAAGGALQTAFNSSFRTLPDTTPPALTSSSPSNNATNVAFNSAIVLNFSKPMNQTSVQSAFSSVPSLTCTWTWTTPQSASCQPNGRLNQQTDYIVTIANSATDSSSNALQAAYEIRFRSGNAPPKVTTFTPNTTFGSVAPNAQITVTFSEDMNKAAVEGAFSVQNNNTPKPGSLTWNSECVLFSGEWVNCRRLIFTPTSNYSPGSNVTWTVSTSALDYATNVGLESAFTRSFRVESVFGP